MNRLTIACALLSILACGTTPTDRYYTALTALAGARGSAIEACRLSVVPLDACQAIHDDFFVPGDLAIQAAEDARQAVITACHVGADTDGACDDATRKLGATLGVVEALTKNLGRALAARGVKP